MKRTFHPSLAILLVVYLVKKYLFPLNLFPFEFTFQGIFFNYEISPMLVIYTESKKPFAHFLTDVCAIVGGIFTVAGLVDGFIYTAERTFKRKLDLGKAH